MAGCFLSLRTQGELPAPRSAYPKRKGAAEVLEISVLAQYINLPGMLAEKLVKTAQVGFDGVEARPNLRKACLVE
jgi:hypothetical protein